MSTALSFVLLFVTVCVLLLSTFFLAFAKFYRRCGADEALVRTGAGGNKVVIGGGIVVYPVLHQLLRVSLRSIKLSVERSAKNALVTKDKIKANVITELYLKVEPLTEDVLAAARSFGERNLDDHAISELIEGKLTDALRSVAANQTFMDLHGKRKEFAEHIQAALTEELKKNGLTLENVSITALAMVPVKDLDSHDVFDAEGLRAITESVQTNAEKTNQIQREKENAIKLQNVEARKQALAMEQDQNQAEADQTRRVAEYRALQQAETAKAVYTQEQARALAEYQKQRAVEAAAIEKQKVIQAAEIDRQKALEAASIEKQKVIEAAEVAKQQTIETARIAKQIAITQSEEHAARATALKLEAEAEQERATQSVITAEEIARANREKDTAVIKAEQLAQETRIAAEREAYKQRLEAEAAAAVVRTAAEAEAERLRIAADAKALAAAKDAEAIVTLAEATLKQGTAMAEAKRMALEAENAVATKLLLRDAVLKTIDVLPAITHELMAPAQAIKEIKVLQLQGGPGTGAGAIGTTTDGPQVGTFGAASPVIRTILEAGAAYPLLREMLEFTKTDSDGLASRAGALLGSLPGELAQIVERDPELSGELGELRSRLLQGANSSKMNGSHGATPAG